MIEITVYYKQNILVVSFEMGRKPELIRFGNRRLRASRALTLCNEVPLRTRRALSP